MKLTFSRSVHALLATLLVLILRSGVETSGADPNIPTTGGTTPLMAAACIKGVI
jgi:hypothetical protein